MAVVFALPHLFDAVVAQFAADGMNVPQTFGWLEPARQQPTTARIVWVPGDTTGMLGDIAAPKYTGMVPRQLFTLNELATVYVTAFDAVNATIERAQYEAARLLFDAWVRAVEIAAYGTYKFLRSEWLLGDRVRRAGATIRTVFAIQAPIVDDPSRFAAVPEDTGALIDVHELDITEQVSVSPEEGT